MLNAVTTATVEAVKEDKLCAIWRNRQRDGSIADMKAMNNVMARL